MKLRTTAAFASLAVVAATALTVASQQARPAALVRDMDQTLKVDPVHSMVVFQINHAGASNPFGVFHALSGTIAKTDTGSLTLDLSVPVAKLDMGNENWEKHIKSPDFFNAAQFPTITFKSTSAKKSADGSFEVAGDLTLHGVTKPMTITLAETGTGKGMQGETRVGYSTTFKIKRADFGVNYLDGKGVGGEVTLMVNLEGVAQ